MNLTLFIIMIKDIINIIKFYLYNSKLIYYKELLNKTNDIREELKIFFNNFYGKYGTYIDYENNEILGWYLYIEVD